LARAKARIEGRLADFRRPPVKGKPTFNASNIKYTTTGRMLAINAGGIGLVHKMAKRLGLVAEIDKNLELLKAHLPYHESDHVLNIAYNILCGGKVLDDLEILRHNEAYLNALGTTAIPDPTTAGDFCRRFATADVETLMEIVNAVRLMLWKAQPTGFLREAKIDVDGIFVSTSGECKEGMDLNYKGEWGYHVLLVSLANTQEPLYLLNRSGNRPSHEGAPEYLDKAIALCRQAGFRHILLRGDTDFALTAHFDRWDGADVRFVFGVDASEPMKVRANLLGADLYEELVRAAREIATKPRSRPNNVKEEAVKARGFRNIRLIDEEVGEFDYRPSRCEKTYRVVVLKKNLTVEEGGEALFADIRYFFYVTNDRAMTADEVVKEANSRCNQENLGAQLKGGVYALRAPLHSLVSNWAYMVMASLAWSLKAWLALSLPETGAEQEGDRQAKQSLLKMEFRSFVNAMILVPCQIINSGRRLIYRLLAWNPWQGTFFRLATVLNC
jgi:hypothetical protein